MKFPSSQAPKGFTLIEIVLASAVAAMILVAIYGIFQHAINLRDNATQRIRDLRLRDRAATVIRDDLRNAYISGGLFASIVQGDSTATDGVNSALPGYLKITTTTGKDTPTDLWGEVQQVEYYVVKGTGTAPGGGGDLVRSVTRDLLDDNPPVTEQPILSNVQTLQVAFYDGTNWQTSWEFNTADNSTTGSTASTSSTNSNNGTTPETLPAAIRVDIQQAPATTAGSTPPPLEIMVPWTMQPFTSPTPAPSASPS